MKLVRLTLSVLTMLFFLQLSLISCGEDTPKNSEEKTDVIARVEIKNLDGIDQIKNLEFTATELNTNETITSEGVQNRTGRFQLSNGLYKFSVKGLAFFIKNGKKDSADFSGVLDQIVIKDQPKMDIVINAFATIKQREGSFKNLVLKEIFISGNLDAAGKLYSWDSYFVIHNNSDNIVYVDSLCILESEFNSQIPSNIDPKGLNEQDFMTHLIYMIPGKGKDHAIPPGGDIILADQAKNHRTLCPSSCDLSHANFEWYEPGQGGRFTDEDNPQVPNLIKVYSYSRTFWRPNMQGNTAFGIGKMQMPLEEFLEKNKVTYTRIFNAEAKRETTCYRFPIAWMADAVQCCPKADIPNAFQMISPELDRGFTYNHLQPRDKEGYGKAMIRKEKESHNNIIIYQDTNNSTEDFLTMVPSSFAK